MKNKIIQGAQAELLDQARTRLIWAVMFLMMGYLAVGLRLTDLTLLRQQAVVVETRGIKPSGQVLRRAIVDRNGTLMAASLTMASVYANTTMVDAPEELATQLVRILPGQDGDDLLRKLSSGKEFVWIQRNITPKQTEAINALGNPALGFQDQARRIYPQGNLAAHVLGYTDVDGNGIAGMEKSSALSLAEKEPLYLSIDLRIQHALHRELGQAVVKFRAKAGIGMVMDVHTGEVIAMVSLPDFDPNHAGDATDIQKFNRATLGVFEMGSTFKIFSTAAALDSGLVNFSDTFDATDPIKQGRFTISDTHPKRRPLTVPEIFIYSSNIGTAKMAAAIGRIRLQDFYKALGFAVPAPLELSERAAPLYPSPWRDITTLTASFGHGIAVSPLHLIRAASGLVNGGIMPQSTLVKAEKKNSLPGKRVVNADASRRVRQLLELAVASGTGANAFVEGYNVGGKTGTAEKNLRGGYQRNALLSSFLGVFPMKNPRYAVLVMLDEPQGRQDTHGFATGGWTAAPVVARVIEQMGPLYGIAPDLTRTRKDIEKEMGVYLKELKEGNSLASLGTDN